MGAARQTAAREADARQRAVADLAAAAEAEEGLRRRVQRDTAAHRQSLLGFDVSLSQWCPHCHACLIHMHSPGPCC